MTNLIMKASLAWLLTYAVHSTLLLGFAWLASRRSAASVATRDLLWKLALVGGVVTASLQAGFGLHPRGSLALTRDATVEGQVARTSARATHTETRDAATTASEDAPVANEETRNIGPSATPVSQPLSMEAWIVLAWGTLALAFAILYLGRRLILVGRLANRQPITSGSLPETLDALCSEIGYTGAIRLTSANTISSPVALGLREICLPEAVLTQLGPDEQRGLLAHELAHLVRRDPLWLYGASLVERIFFFQPLNRLARKELQVNSEYACDDWAAARTGSGLPLANCLARVAEWIEASPLGVPVAGMAEQRSLLVTRVARLIDGAPSGSPRSKVVLGSAAAALFAGVIAAAPGVQSHAAQAPVSPSRPAAVADSARNENSQNDAQGDDEQAKRARQEDPAVITALIERLKDTDAGVRRAAASSLGRLKSRRAVNPLIDALNDKNAEVRAAIVEALGEMEDATAMPALAKMLNDESADVREHVLDALGNFPGSLTAAQVLPALRDPKPSLRAKAAEVLGEIKDRAALAPLEHALGDPSADVRHEAVHALEHLDDASASSSIVPLLHDDNADVRDAAWSALRELKANVGDAEITRALKDPAANVRGEVIDYLKEHPTPNMVAALRALVDDTNGDVREQAVDALSEVRDASARAALRDALKSPDPKVRRRAAEALGDRP